MCLEVLDNVIMCLKVGLHGKNCRVFGQCYLDNEMCDVIIYFH
jgi:hypothetical protein